MHLRNLSRWILGLKAEMRPDSACLVGTPMERTQLEHSAMTSPSQKRSAPKVSPPCSVAYLARSRARLYPRKDKSKRVYGPSRQKRLCKHRHQRVCKDRHTHEEPAQPVNENIQSNRHAQQQVGDGDVLRLAIVAASHKVSDADLPNCLFDPSHRERLHPAITLTSNQLYRAHILQ